MATIHGAMVKMLLLLMVECPSGLAQLFECLIPFHYCLGSLLPLGYTMQNAQVSAAILQMPSVCGTLEQARACTARYPCNHESSRDRLLMYLGFFTWLCQQSQVLQDSAQCWEYPFEHDVIACGELHIAGHMGQHLLSPYHPCPYIPNMVNCIAEKMYERPVCLQEAIEVYGHIILNSSVAFAGCRVFA